MPTITVESHDLKALYEGRPVSKETLTVPDAAPEEPTPFRRGPVARRARRPADEPSPKDAVAATADDSEGEEDHAD